MWRKFLDALMGSDAPGRVPGRVRRAIEAQQQNSEILIAWAQLAVVTVFGLLYFVSPKAFDADAMFAPVPYVLGVFFLFSLLRLAVVRGCHAPGWFLGLAVVADMGLLMLLIWTFHIQYQQPAALYLKAPTLLYVFIFIALRALRFEARYVLLAGAAAAVGWLALLAYAALVDPSAEMITRNYVEYTLSHKILLGAEFDKIISISVVTLILALALLRARRLLVRAVAEAEAAKDLSRFFAPEVARAITAAEDRVEAGSGELREAAILHVDIEGFTRLSKRLNPTELVGLLSEYESRMVAVIRKHGGSVDKFLGDGILASFGAVMKTETHAADALRALEDLLRAADEWRELRAAAGQEPIGLRFTMAAGTVVFGAIGDPSRLEFTVIGDPVNLAAKLDDQAKREGVRALTSAESFGCATSQGYAPAVAVRTLEDRLVEGLGVRLDLVALEL